MKDIWGNLAQGVRLAEEAKEVEVKSGEIQNQDIGGEFQKVEETNIDEDIDFQDTFETVGLEAEYVGGYVEEYEEEGEDDDTDALDWDDLEEEPEDGSEEELKDILEIDLDRVPEDGVDEDSEEGSEEDSEEDSEDDSEEDSEEGSEEGSEEDTTDISPEFVREPVEETEDTAVQIYGGMTLLDFLRVNPDSRDVSKVQKYYTQDVIDIALKKGDVFLKKGRLII